MSSMAISGIVLGCVVALSIWNRLQVEIVASGAALVFYATGVLRLPESLAGFGDATVIFIATLFIISEGIDASRITTRVGRRLVASAGASKTRLLICTLTLLAVLSALIGINGAVAAWLPVLVLIAVSAAADAGISARPPLMTVTAAAAASFLTPVVTRVNLTVSEPGGDRFGDYWKRGLVLLLIAVDVLLLPIFWRF